MKSYPFPLQPMSVVRIIDYTFKILKSRFKEIAFFSFLVYGSVTFISSSLMAVSISNFMGPIGSLFADSAGYGQDMLMRFFSSLMGILGVVMLIFLITEMLIMPFVNTVISTVVYEYYTGMPRRPIKDLFKSAIKKLGKIILTNALRIALVFAMGSVLYFVFLILIAILMLTFMSTASYGVAGMIIFLLFYLCFILFVGTSYVCFTNITFSIMGNEDIYYMEAVSKAVKYTFSRFFKMVGVFLIIILLTLALTYSLYLLLFSGRMLWGAVDTLMLQDMFSGPMMYVFVLFSLLIGILLAPLVPIVTTLFYIDTRIVKEGLDLTLRERDLSQDDSSGFSFEQWGGQEGDI